MNASVSLIGLTAFGIAAMVAWPLGRLAWSWGFVDRPAARKHHQRSTPMLGGVALMLGVMVPPFVYLTIRDGGVSMSFLALVAGATLLLAVGLVDDRLGVSVPVKLLTQSVAAALIVTAGFGGPWEAALGPLLGTVVTMIWLVGLTNAFNLLDNVDGLAAGIAAVAAIGIFAVDASLFADVIALSVVGACLGFLVHNWSPARMFMGDAGSLPLGLIVATISLEIGHRGAPVDGFFQSRWMDAPPHLSGWILPAVILAVPIVDTVTVCVSRLRLGRNPLTTPGTDHLSHRLLRRGLSVRSAVSLLVFAGLLANGLALFIEFVFALPATAAAEVP